MMSGAELELDTLLAPLADQARCGPSLLHDPVFDAIREARREDDASLPQGVWTAPLKKADWPAVTRLCTQVLATRSKDVQVAAIALRMPAPWLADRLCSLQRHNRTP